MSRFVLLALLSLLVVPASARASVASPDGTIVTITGGPEDNVIALGTGVDATGIQDVAGITAGPGCTQPDPTTVTCGRTYRGWVRTKYVWQQGTPHVRTSGALRRG